MLQSPALHTSEALTAVASGQIRAQKPLLYLSGRLYFVIEIFSPSLCFGEAGHDGDGV